MLVIQKLSYIHPGKDVLFSNVDLTVNDREKLALIGNNGTGKSTLLRMITGELRPASGTISLNTDVYYVPQVFGQYDHLSVAQAVRIEKKCTALKHILEGDTTEQNFAVLNDDWTIEERSRDALAAFDLHNVDLTQTISSLSGGQKTKLFLAGIRIHEPQLVLLDEPSNHLDSAGRKLLYDLITTANTSFVVVSHDRTLLNLLDTTCELHNNGIKVYGGNYEFYTEQKKLAQNALLRNIESKEKALRKAKEKERETIERQHKLDSRGKAKQETAGVARIMMNTLRNNAENSTAKLKTAHTEKTGNIANELKELRTGVPAIDTMRFGFDDSDIHNGKILLRAEHLNYSYADKPLWLQPLHFIIKSGERITLKGTNGAGKTTLLHLIIGNLQPTTGTLYRAADTIIYIDQQYSLLNNGNTVYQQAASYNTTGLQEHEIRIKLHRFLFTKNDWDKKCSDLSGGERMRLLLCCVTINKTSPDLIILDEPTNNLDIQNVEILTAALNEYHGTLIVVSHDDVFVQQLNLNRSIVL